MIEGVRMAYGITSESQLIDYNTIRNGCSAYMDSLDYFMQAAKQVMEAAEMCDKKALNVDGQTMQPVLYELAQQIANVANEYASRVNEVNVQAVNVYNAQVRELNAYYQRLAQEQAAKNN